MANLIHRLTEQKVEGVDADEFMANIVDPENWMEIAGAPAGKVIEIDLAELRAAVATNAAEPEAEQQESTETQDPATEPTEQEAE